MRTTQWRSKNKWI